MFHHPCETIAERRTQIFTTKEASNINIYQFRRAMPREMKQYDREDMKNTMIKQEEIFRYQVHELHRLYRIQKQLMTEMKCAEMKKQRHETKDLEIWDVNTRAGSNKQARGEAIVEASEESDLELRLFTGSGRVQSKTKDSPFTSDSGSSLSSISSNETGEMNQAKKEWAVLLQLRDVSTRSTSERKIRSGIEEQVMKDGLNQPPWLFQCSKKDMIVSFGL